MELLYRAALRNAVDVGVRVEAFVVTEGYSAGWGGTALITARHRTAPSAGEMLAAVMASGVTAGTSVFLDLLGYPRDTSPTHAQLARSWPSMVKSLHPQATGARSAACEVRFVDPVGYLADRPIWGAYRAASAAEITGGALSLAAGGDGKPTLTPALPGMPRVRIVARYREKLTRLPYAIAAGQSLGDWLSDFLGMLGLRAELSVDSDEETVVLTLSDQLPSGDVHRMTAVEGSDSVPVDPDSLGPIAIGGMSAFSTPPVRGGLLDEPSMGTAFPVVAYGAIGHVLSGSGLDVEESSDRVLRAATGESARMLTLAAATGLPTIQPGSLVRLDRAVVLGVDVWQVFVASHAYQGDVYHNSLTLLRGDISWHPALPEARQPTIVNGVVDAGAGFELHDPVPRDRLGRIRVRFPFTPTPVGEEAREFDVADTDGDRRITLADFTAEQIGDYTDNPDEWEATLAAFEFGQYDDPFPGRSDEELTPQESSERDRLRARRNEAIAYGAYRKAKQLDEADRDRDGVVSMRDAMISDELSEAIRDDERRRELDEQWQVLAQERREAEAEEAEAEESDAEEADAEEADAGESAAEESDAEEADAGESAAEESDAVETG